MNQIIPFNRPTITGRESRYIEEVFRNGVFSGDGVMGSRCNDWLRKYFDAESALVTTSCTHALEMAALLCDLKPGDEVIMPSFAFPTIATAFARTGAELVFVDVEPATMNLDKWAVKEAVKPSTRVIVALHYAGVGCDMDAIEEIARNNNIIIVEDAAQGMFSNYGSRPLGTIGTFGCISFHESKNIHCGEGGALIINTPGFADRAKVILDKGTNRAQFRKGRVAHYTWCDLGSSYGPSDLNSAFLLAQLEEGRTITAERVKSWSTYRSRLAELAERGVLDIPHPHAADQHNGHVFWLKVRDKGTRDNLLDHLHRHGICATFHYIPLHSAPAGLRYGRFEGEDRHTTSGSERLLRLPQYHGFRDWDRVVEAILEFFRHE